MPVGQYSLDFLDKVVKDGSLGADYKDKVLANVVSGLLIKEAVKRFGAENLLYVGAATILAALACQRWLVAIGRSEPEAQRSVSASPARAQGPIKIGEDVKAAVGVSGTPTAARTRRAPNTGLGKIVHQLG